MGEVERSEWTHYSESPRKLSAAALGCPSTSASARAWAPRAPGPRCFRPTGSNASVIPGEKEARSPVGRGAGWCPVLDRWPPACDGQLTTSQGSLENADPPWPPGLSGLYPLRKPLSPMWPEPQASVVTGQGRAGGVYPGLQRRALVKPPAWGSCSLVHDEEPVARLPWQGAGRGPMGPLLLTLNVCRNVVFASALGQFIS